MNELHEASRSGDVKEVKSAIRAIFAEIADPDRGHVLTEKDAQHLTSLHYAVKYNHLETVRLLIEKGANVNVRGKEGATPLHYATRYMRPEEDDCSILQLLIHNEADVNAKDDFGSAPLHYACLKGNIKAVRELLKSKDINVKAVDKLNSTPLHSACTFGSSEFVELLLGHGAEVLTEDDAKMTALHVACSQGHEKLVNYLFDVIEDKHGLTAVPRIIEHKNSEGQSLLHLAVLGSHLDISKLLLERGSNVNQVMDEMETPLHVAAVIGKKEIVKLLIAHGSDVNLKNEGGRTALHKAARFGKHRVVDMLIKQGTDVNSRDNDQLTPLMLASQSSGNSHTLSILLKHGADSLLYDKENRTALQVAVIDNNVRSVETLLESEASKQLVNMKDKDSNTGLHIACKQGFEEIAIILLKENADVQSRNNDEKTPLHITAFYGQIDVVDNIVDINPSTINDTDREGNAALHLAAQNGHTDVMKYLLKTGAAVNDKNTQSMTALDCAAANGQTEAVKILIWGGASVQPNENGITPLHRSCIEGHAETIELLLKYCDIGLTEEHGRNALDLCLDNKNKDAAIAILDHRDWKKALRNKTMEDGKITTPIRKMIKRMPELATYTFDRCIKETDEYRNDDDEYNITLSYEFLDDVYNEWHCDVVREDTKEGHGKGELYSRSSIQKNMEKKETHTLSYMVENNRPELLSHPLCSTLIERKWRTFAAYLYYFKLSLYTLFLIFLTGYILVSAPLREPYRDEECTISIENRTWDMVVFIQFGKWAVMLLALIHLAFELVQLASQRLDYFAWGNLIEWTVYILAIVNVIDDFIELPLQTAGLVCGVYQKSTGALCVFLAWLNFILFIQKVPVFGIYIVMFLYVISTFLKFFVIFVFLILAFGFSFHILLHDEKSLSAFHSPVGALIKTGVMMTGELNFDDIFFSDANPPSISWVLFVLFILIMVIVLMNLLVGLAVDDIQEVQKQAEMTKATMQIDICLDAEATLPKTFRKKFIVSDLVIYPNKKEISHISEDALAIILQIIIQEKEPIDQLHDNLKTLQGNVSVLDTKVVQIDEQLGTLHSMLEELIKYQQQRRRSKKSVKPTQKEDVEQAKE